MKKLHKKLAMTLFLILGLVTTVFVMSLLFNVTDYGITIASFGATVFMLLAKKKLDAKKVFGAYFIATFLGYFASKLPSITSFNVAVATVFSFLLMDYLQFQHAPALGFSIAMVLNKFSFTTDLIVILCIFFILGMAIVLKQFMKNPESVINYIEIENEKVNWDF